VPDLTVALFGGVYNNYLALEAVLADAERAGADEFYCLGDIGGFGPHPDRAADRLRNSDVHCLQGNYDDSVGHGLDDCQCGYTDPRDNHFAQISFDYTLKNTSETNRAWMRTLQPSHRTKIGGHRVLMCHGSPRRVNEFLWESMTPPAFIERLLEEEVADRIFVTHTGIHWARLLEDGRGVINVGAIGRPANDGDPAVHYCLLRDDRYEFRRVEYDHRRLAREIRDEGLPEEFAETIETGWWTSCLEILPAKERAAGRY